VSSEAETVGSAATGGPGPRPRRGTRAGVARPRGGPDQPAGPAPETGRDEEPDGPVGVVLAGAGARGAYEAGVLSVLLPALEEQDHRPTIFVGTSAGAINAALFASQAHLPAESAVREVLSTWRSIRKQMVMRPAWQTLPMVTARYLARVAGLSVPLPGLLDTSPLRRSLQSEALVDWSQLHANVLDQTVDVVSVVTTEFGSNRTKVFFESSRDEFLEPLPSDEERAVDFAHVVLTPDHILASAAIPAAFPPVRLGTAQDGSWHMDGGVRLNTPLKPALTFGARRLVVIATDPARYRTSPRKQAAGPAPSVQDGINQIVHGSASDGMIEDLWNLVRVNVILTAAGGHDVVKPHSPAGLDDVYRVVPFIFGGPLIPDEIGGTAAQALDASLQGVRALLNPDLSVLRLLLGSGADTRADLISYVFFEPEFIDAAIKRGQDDAQVILQQTPSLWKTTEV
jgi:NTE family protein